MQKQNKPKFIAQVPAITKKIILTDSQIKEGQNLTSNKSKL